MEDAKGDDHVAHGRRESIYPVGGTWEGENSLSAWEFVLEDS